MSFFICAGCDNTIRANHGTILSPGNMVVPYASSAVCKYTIQVPDGSAKQPLTLLVNAFDVEQDDYLQVRVCMHMCDARAHIGVRRYR
jgi:hypothetical protein